MASRKITQLTELTAPASADVLPIVDVSEASPENQNKKITYAELLSSAPAGTAAAPAFAFDGDPNSGLYSVGADQVAISTGGTGRLFIDASGNIGVGTTSIQAALDVQGTNFDLGNPLPGFASGNFPTFRIATNDSTRLVSFQQLYGGDNTLKTFYSYSGNDHIWQTANALERMRLDASGRLGIGTVSPVTALHVHSSGALATFVGNSANEYIQVSDNNGSTSATFGAIGGGDCYIFSGSGKSTRIYAGANERLRITSAGLVGIGTSAPYRTQTIRGTNETLQFDLNTTTNGTYSSICWNGATVDLGPGGQSAEIRGYREGGTAFGALAFHTRGTTLTSVERLRIDSSGRVGIGTSSPTQRLQVTDGALSNFYVAPGYNSGVGTLLATGGSEYLAFATNGLANERARIDSSGRLLVGTSTAPQSFEGGTTIGIQAENTGNGNKNLLRLVSNAVANWPPVFSFARSRGTANGAVTAVASGDVLGATSYAGADGTGHIVAAQIFAAVDGTPGTNDMPGRLVFSTTADGAATPTERLRITSAGLVGIGTTSPLFPLDVNGVIYTRGRGSTFGVLFDDWRIYNSTAPGALVFDNGSERARIDSSGRLLVGAATSADVGGASAIAQFTSTAVAPHTLSLVRANTPILAMANSGSVSSGSGLGAILFCGNDGTDLNSLGARIVAEVDGTPSADDMPGRLVFSTTADGAASPTERMRITSAGATILYGNGAASTSALSSVGTWFTGGTTTTTKPQLLIEPTGTTSTAWSTSGTGLGVNAASGFAGNLLDLQVNGTSDFRISSGVVERGYQYNLPQQRGGTGIQVSLGGGANGLYLGSDLEVSWSSSIATGSLSIFSGSKDLRLARDAAGILAQRNGTNAQTFRVYNTFTDASNYERGFLRWSSNVFEVGPEAAGTGTARPMRITAATLKLPNLPTYADNAAATTGGLVAGDVYKTATGELRITV